MRSLQFFPNGENVELVDNDGDGEVDEMVLNIDRSSVTSAVETANTLASVATFFVKYSVMIMGGFAAVEAFLVSRLGMSAGAAAVAADLMVDGAEDMFEEAMRDYYFDYLTGISERPYEYPLENQFRNPYGIIYHP